MPVPQKFEVGARVLKKRPPADGKNASVGTVVWSCACRDCVDPLYLVEFADGNRGPICHSDLVRAPYDNEEDE